MIKHLINNIHIHITHHVYFFKWIYFTLARKYCDYFNYFTLVNSKKSSGGSIPNDFIFGMKVVYCIFFFLVPLSMWLFSHRKKLCGQFSKCLPFYVQKTLFLWVSNGFKSITVWKNWKIYVVFNKETFFYLFKAFSCTYMGNSKKNYNYQNS